jgi:hypothetical protein
LVYLLFFSDLLKKLKCSDGNSFSLLFQIKFYFSNGKLLGIVYAISWKTYEDCPITCAFLNEFWIAFQNLMKEMVFFSFILFIHWQICYKHWYICFSFQIYYTICRWKIIHLLTTVIARYCFIISLICKYYMFQSNFATLSNKLLYNKLVNVKFSKLISAYHWINYLVLSE